ncbi:MAG TPA: nuclear transport factor 2 family protein [Phenylobacterium sp.]|nr:nuclear transport factor 2 family protein [Phenylobacterium sp.]
MTTTNRLTPADLAQGQLEAYNAQDVDALCGFFADDLVVADFNGAVTVQGVEAFRSRHVALFAEHPQNRAELAHRIIIGERVIDHERVYRQPGPVSFEVAAIYTIADGKIARIDFVK